MENSQIKRNKNRIKRTMRNRKRLRGCAEQPRLCVIKSNNHVYAQLIDDEKAITLASISTLSKEFGQTEFNRKNVASAKQLGLKMAELAKAKGVSRVIYDRGCRQYHGVIASVAEGAREGGLVF